MRVRISFCLPLCSMCERVLRLGLRQHLCLRRTCDAAVLRTTKGKEYAYVPKLASLPKIALCLNLGQIYDLRPLFICFFNFFLLISHDLENVGNRVAVNPLLLTDVYPQERNNALFAAHSETFCLEKNTFF